MASRLKKRFFVRPLKEEPDSENSISISIEEKHSTDILFWVPRILSFAFILFLSIFALDVVGEYQGIHIVFPLIMHLLPNLVLLVILLFAWKFDLVESFVFLCFCVIYIVLVGVEKNWSVYAFICGPAIAISILFLLHWYLRKGKKII